MAFDLDFSEQAQKDVQLHKKAGNKAVLKKILGLFTELTEHPFEGTGKPEPLKHQLTGYWSRKINQEHRIIYKVTDNIVHIASVYGHYL